MKQNALTSVKGIATDDAGEPEVFDFLQQNALTSVKGIATRELSGVCWSTVGVEQNALTSVKGIATVVCHDTLQAIHGF